MIRDGIVWAVGSAMLQGLDADPSMVGFVKNASVVGSIIAAGWVVEARIGKKIGSAIMQHTAVEDERLKVVKTEIRAEVQILATKLDGIHDKLDSRPCAATCGHGDHR
jgi:uncharacterized protein (DUF697 family)